MEKIVQTVCFDCHSKCGVRLHVEDNEIIRVEGDPDHPISEGMLCTKAFSAQDIHAHPDRLKYPLKRVGERGAGDWERISWDQALTEIAECVNKNLAEYGPTSVISTQGTGRGSNHFHGRFQSTIGAPGFGLAPTHVCLLPNLAQTHLTWGRMLHPHEACDYRAAKCVVAWGTNPIRSRQYCGLRMLDGHRDGGKLIVIDPVYRDMAAKADLWIPIRPGTDSVIAFAISNMIIKNKTYNEDTMKTWTNAPFLVNDVEKRLLRESDIDASADPFDDHYVVWNEKTNSPAIWCPETETYIGSQGDPAPTERFNGSSAGVDPVLDGTFEVTLANGETMECKTAFTTYKEWLEPWTPEKAAEIGWFEPSKLYEMYDILMNNKPALTAAYLGACMMTTNALQTGRAITLLQLLLDPPIDAKGGLHFNKFWEFMNSPKISANDAVTNPVSRLGDDKYPMYTQIYGKAAWPPALWEAIITEKPWPVKVLISNANDVLGCYENPQKAHEALTCGNLDMYVVMDYWMTPSAELADYVLPAAHWSERVGCFDEEMYPDPCPFIMPVKAVDPPGEAQDDWFFYRELGMRIVLDGESRAWLWPWDSSEEMQLWRLNEFHLKPTGREPIETYEEAADEHMFIVYGGEHRIEKQHEKGIEHFATPTAKIDFYCESMPIFGYDSALPTFSEPWESPITQPEEFEKYPFVLTTGGRDYPFYHSAWTNIAKQRILEPWPYVEINYYDAQDMQIADGEWVYVENSHGKVKARARVHKGILKGVISMARPNYKDACKELNLPGGSWDTYNPNMLIPKEGADPGFGATVMRSCLARITKIDE